MNERKGYMPKMTKIYGGDPDATPLKVTHRKRRGRQAPRTCVTCGCCKESLVICPPDDSQGNPFLESMEINGVNGTIAEWRELLCPLLGLKIPRT